MAADVMPHPATRYGGLTPVVYERTPPRTDTPGVYRRWHWARRGADLTHEAEWLASEYHVPVCIVASFESENAYGPCITFLAEYERCPTCGNPQLHDL